MSKRLSALAIFSSLIFFLLFSSSSVGNAQEVIVDNGAPGTSYTGTWGVSGGTNAYGADSLWSRSGATYTWHADLPETGIYEILMWWTAYSSRSTNVPVTVQHSGGSQTVYINQQQNGGRWNSLGTYILSSAAGGTVTLAAPDPAPTSYCADAVQFAYIGPAPNLPPVAVIDSINPNPALPGQTVSFVGHGTDSDGTVMAYSWRSSIDGDLSDSASFSTAALSEGYHTIFFSVQDDQGDWSPEVSQSLLIAGAPTEIIIDNGTAGTSSTGTWSISGALNPYGADSLWSRSGATYTWHATLPQSGMYEVFMWWTAYSSRSTNAPVAILYSGGSQSFYVNEQQEGGKWNSLGTYNFDSAAGGTVRVSAPDPAPTSYCADAVRFLYAGVPANVPPVALIDSISPNPAVTGQSVSFSGHGTDSDGTVTGYAWRSSISGSLSTSASFSTSSLSQGTHTIFFRVQDNQGAWSPEVSQSLVVNAPANVPPVAAIDSISPNPAVTGQSVSFVGHGTDSDGTVTGYAWRSSIDGQLSNSASFTISTLTQGAHTITFTVRDDDGDWSSDVSRTLTVNAQTSSTERIFICKGYNWLDTRPYFEAALRDLGAQEQGGVWRYTNTSQNRSFEIRFVTSIEGMRQALMTEGANVIYAGHSNYGLGGVFATQPEQDIERIDNIFYIDDDRIFNYSTPWVNVNIRNMRTSHAFPHWLPMFKNGESGVMPYDFDDPRGNPPYNYYLTYQLPNDPNHYMIETVRQGAVRRFPDSNTPAWYSPDGTPPDPTNPNHLRYFITNPPAWRPSINIIGTWTEDNLIRGFFKENYFYTAPGQGATKVEFTFTIPQAGDYYVFGWWPASADLAPNVPCTVNHALGATTILVDERANGGRWNNLGVFSFDEGEYSVVVDNDVTRGSVVADAIRVAHLDDPLEEIVQANFYAQPLSGVAPLRVRFVNQSTGDLTGRRWEFGDGATNETRDDVNHTYNAPGTYTVSLTVSGPAGSSTRTRTACITVGNSSPVLRAEFSRLVLNDTMPLQVTLNDRSSGNPVSWSWDFGDGSTSHQQNPTHTYTTTGYYPVSLTITDASAQTAAETKQNFVSALIFSRNIDNLEYPKAHYGSKTILFRRDPEICQEEMRFSRMFYDSCNSGNYYLEMIGRGIVFYTTDTSDSWWGAVSYLRSCLQGRSDQETWEILQSHDSNYDYFNFNKYPWEQ